MSGDVRDLGGAEEQAALDWAIRAGDPAFAEWEALTLWLEGDEGRADRYNRAAAALADVTALVATLGPTSPAMAPRASALRRPGRRWVAAGALAAAAAAGIIGYRQTAPVAQPYAVATGPAQTRALALADGSRIVLAGGTRLVLDRADPRVATVQAGAAVFTVRHDPARPFRVRAGGEDLVDLGTIFDVGVDARGLTVAVAEGCVRVGAGSGQVDLDAGERLEVRDGGRRRTVSRVAPDVVGAWATGQLSYRAAPVGEVAAAVARALGQPIAVAPAIAVRPFTGIVALDSVRRDPAALGPIVGGLMVRHGDEWELRPAS